MKPKRVNFNQDVNQDRCIYRSYTKKKKPYVYRHMVLQWFMYFRNYGWIRYKGRVYNLNRKDQSDAFFKVLMDEGFLVAERFNCYTILDPDYHGFTNIDHHQVLYHLYETKGQPLGRLECWVRDLYAKHVLRLS